MNFENITDVILVAQLKSLVAKEREILAEVLHHLLEVEKRKIYFEGTCTSLFDYCLTVLGYTSQQAYRRITAMRVLKVIPAIHNQIKDGSLSLTHLNQAQHYFSVKAKKDEPLSRQDKAEVLLSIANKTTRESEKHFAKLDPGFVQPEKVRIIDDEIYEIRFNASNVLMEKLTKFKELDSHKNVNPSYAELFERLVDLALAEREKKLNPKGAALKRKKTTDKSTVGVSINPSMKASVNASIAPIQSSILSASIKSTSAGVSTSTVSKKTATESEIARMPKTTPCVPAFNSRYISAQTKKIVWYRDQGACAYIDAYTGKRCQSQHRLQFDHIVPFAKAGTNTAENLRLLCQSHNLMMAERIFGAEKISKYRRPNSIAN